MGFLLGLGAQGPVVLLDGTCWGKVEPTQNGEIGRSPRTFLTRVLKLNGVQGSTVMKKKIFLFTNHYLKFSS